MREPELQFSEEACQDNRFVGSSCRPLEAQITATYVLITTSRECSYMMQVGHALIEDARYGKPRGASARKEESLTH